MPGVNDGLSSSAVMIAQLRTGEGSQHGGADYTDPTGNCTRGHGTLVHHGACSPAELAAQPDARRNETDFISRIQAAEQAVRSAVPSRRLTQDQFDALVSATYNLGPTGAASILDSANQTDDPGVVRRLRDRVNAEVRGPGGRRTGRMVRLPGLVTRREHEARPFLSGNTAAQPGAAR